MTTPVVAHVIGPDAGPEPPFPLRMEGTIVAGYGRGRELGIRTANLPIDVTASPWLATVDNGVYFGWAGVTLDPQHPDYHPHSDCRAGADDNDNDNDGAARGSPSSCVSSAQVYPMVMSIGYNPFFGNDHRTAEVHLLHTFRQDFYGAHLRVSLLGYIRPEANFDGWDALVHAIHTDMASARASVQRPAWAPPPTHRHDHHHTRDDDEVSSPDTQPLPGTLVDEGQWLATRVETETPVEIGTE